jgi:hypothetical protein
MAMSVLLIVYDHDSNSILHCILKNKTGAEIKRGWQHIHERLARGGNQPKMYILDNEALADLKTALAKYDLTYQLVPPHLLRMLQNELSVPTRATSWRALQHVILTFPFPNGIKSYSKLN